MREDFIASGVKFLRHPNVQKTPISQRVAFLKQKGLSNDEVEAAIARHHTPNEQVTPNSESFSDGLSDLSLPLSVASNKTDSPIQLQEHNSSCYSSTSNWIDKSLVFTALVGASSVIGAALYSLWGGKQAPPVTENREEASYRDSISLELSRINESVTSQTRELDTIVKALRDSTEAVVKQLKEKAASEDSKTAMQAILDLHSEISSIKMLLLSGTGNSALASTAKIPAPAWTAPVASSSSNELTRSLQPIRHSPVDDLSPVQVGSPAVGTVLEKFEKMIAALATVLRVNTSDQVKDGTRMMYLYVTNIMENPDLPRYRRISTHNSNYAKCLRDVNEHIPFLESIGFRRNGSQMEWSWHSPKSDVEDNMVIMKCAKAALSQATNGATIAEIECKSREELKNCLGTQKIETVVDTTEDAERFKAFMATLSTEDVSTYKRESERADAPVNVERNTDTTESNQVQSEAKELSFAEVMQLMQAGEQVPGIEEIEDKLSVDAEKPSISSCPPRAKPWETI